MNVYLEALVMLGAALLVTLVVIIAAFATAQAINAWGLGILPIVAILWLAPLYGVLVGLLKL
jgi:hypothetical protein